MITLKKLLALRKRHAPVIRARRLESARIASPPDVCHAHECGGECNWMKCPQAKDGEPDKSGRCCPIDERAESISAPDAGKVGG
jgi:hypothetical protein